MSGNSDHELSRKKRKAQKLKIAEAERETIELKISDDNVDDIVEDNSESDANSGNNMLVSETQSKEQAEEQLEEQLEAPLQETIVAAETADESNSTPQPLPPLPKLKMGMLTAIISICAFLLIPSEITSRHGDFNPLTSASFITAIVFYVLHLVWFYISQKQLIKHTVPHLPECASAAGSRTVLLSLLPLAWISLVGYFFSQLLYLSAYPVIQMLPWLLLISAIYFTEALNYWPSKLKKLCSDQQKKSFPNKFVGVFLGGFMTVPFIWYWLKAVKAVNKTDTATAFKLQTRVVDRDKMVIRYRPFIAIERWFKHRHKTTSKKERYINAAIAITINLALLQLFCMSFPDLAGALGKLLNPLFTPPASSGTTAAGNTFTISNQTFLALIGALSATIVAMVIRFVLKQPTNYEFTPLGFRSFRWLGEKKKEGEIIPWNSLTSIELNSKNQKGQTTASELQFNRDNGDPIKLSMGAVESVEDREIILDAIERWAPGVSRSAALVQALQPPVDHSYTEMWLQALSAPPQRDRLKPLTEDIVLNDGRYRVKRSLGVGGQGAAYSAYDQASGDTVVLKEFLLPIYVDISIRKDVLESFESEARILKHLNHDQVVKLKDFFVEDHRAYLVLEHIDGKSLREVVAKEGPLPEERVRDLTRQMCTILNYLHSQEPQVVHRDFTPENLILRNDGVLKLIDFNVARQVESNATGSVVGKPAYLPPEQFRGQPVSQSDIYGMGATLSFLLTGKEPEPISVSHPREENSQVSIAMDKIVAKATAINLKDRYANCHQIIQDLDKPSKPNDDDEKGDENNDNNSGDNNKGAKEKAADPQKEPDAEPKKEALKEPPYATFSTAAPFKIKEGMADNITLKVVDRDNLVSSGQLTLPEEDDPVLGDLVTAQNSQSERNPNQVSLQFNSAAKTNSVASIVAAIGAFVSWLTITIAVAWMLIPGSPAWFDSKAALHSHGHAAAAALFRSEANKALDECNKCIAIDPNCALAYFGRAISYTLDLKDGDASNKLAYEKALADLRKAVALSPLDYSIQTAYGAALSHTGYYAEAEAAFKKALVLEHSAVVPDLIETVFHPKRLNQSSRRYELAKAQLYQMNYKDAIKFYDTLKTNGDYGYDCRTTDQITAYELAHQPQEALDRSTDPFRYSDEKKSDKTSLFPIMMHRAALERAIAATAIDSTCKPVMNLFYDGLALHGMGRYEQAVEKLSQAIEIMPNYTDFYLFRGSCYRYLHKYDLAMVDFQTALQQQPANEYAQYMKQQVLDNLSGKGSPKEMNWRGLE
jgi:serine/threonine protein kinase/Tfp pilus assembly protein PilF